jgi:hypothetical protein
MVRSREIPIPKVVRINGPIELGLVIFLFASKRLSSEILVTFLKKKIEYFEKKIKKGDGNNKATQKNDIVKP